MKRKGIKRKGGNEVKKSGLLFPNQVLTVVLEVPQWYYCFCFGSRSLRVS